MTSRIYTGTGDGGTTALVGGDRVAKDHLRVEAYGTVDEANSWVGVARTFTADTELLTALEFVQHRLFNCSSNLATLPNSGFEPTRITEGDVLWLEAAIDRYEAETGPIRSFILPGGSQAASFLHIARTVIRRAERRIVSLGHHDWVDPLVLRFVNRLSDFFFAAARLANRRERGGDVTWDAQHQPLGPKAG